MSEYQDEEFDKKSFEEEAKAISQSILEKHLVARKFDENNTKKWGDLIIDEIHKTLSDKYEFSTSKTSIIEERTLNMDIASSFICLIGLLIFQITVPFSIKKLM